MRHAVGSAARVGGEDAACRRLLHELDALGTHAIAEDRPAFAGPARGIGLLAADADERIRGYVVRPDRHAHVSKKRRLAGAFSSSYDSAQLPPPVVAGSTAAGVSAGPAGNSASTGSAACALR